MSAPSHTAECCKLSGTVVVTGGNRGIGYAYSHALAQAGSNVAIIYRSHKDAQEKARELQEKFKDVKIRAYQSDVCSSEKLQETFKQIEQDMPTHITGVIANAGISVVKSAMDLNQEDFQKVFGVNVFGVFNTCRAAAKLWKGRNEKGSIVITASMSAQIVNQVQPNEALTQAFYNSSKAAVRMLSKTLAAEWAKDNIRVNSVSPGYVETDQTGVLGGGIKDSQKGSVPLRRFAQPKEIAPQALLLLSDHASYMTGGDYVVDGGHLVW